MRDQADANQSQSRTDSRWRVDDHVPPPLPIPEHQQSEADREVRSTAPPCERLAQPTAPTRIKIHEGHRRGNESGSWLSSLILHGVLIGVLALLIAPMDLGGISKTTLVVTFSEPETISEETFASKIVGEEPSHEDPLPVIEEPVPVAMDDVFDVASSAAPVPSGSGATSKGSTGSTQGTRGTFFGIEAYGHEFVYVLDMSGSMSGRRFKRATAELIRSVNELSDNQSFYVFLFNGHTTPMFNERSATATSIPATQNNKRRLSSWLRNVFRGGSTDPRGALRASLKMNPSAVFMLSDGEFDDPTTGKKKGRNDLLLGNANAFAIVKGSGSKVPIHAIAFEDPSSCRNMKRLASMTGGEYRFTGYKDFGDVDATMAAARAAVQTGDSAGAEILFREVIELATNSKAADEAREELSKALTQTADSAIEQDDINSATEVLTQLMELDPDAVKSGDTQQKLVEYARSKPAKLAKLDPIIRAHPKAKISKSIRGSIAEELLQKAEELADSNHMDAFIGMRTICVQYGGTKAAEKAQSELERLSKLIWESTQETLNSQGEVAYAKRLEAISVKCARTDLAERCRAAHQDLANLIWGRFREAKIRKDSEAQQEAEQLLARAFAGNKSIEAMRREFATKEVNARAMLRRGTRLERSSGKEPSIKVYRDIVKHYPATWAAAQAKERLDDLAKSDEAVVQASIEEQNKLTLQMMLQQGE